MNKKAIQFLRTTSNGVVEDNKDIEIAAGQPFYNSQKNYLSVGNLNGTSKVENSAPLNYKILKGYFTDDNGVTNEIENVPMFLVGPSFDSKNLNILNSISDSNGEVDNELKSLLTKVKLLLSNNGLSITHDNDEESNFEFDLRSNNIEISVTYENDYLHKHNYLHLDNWGIQLESSNQDGSTSKAILNEYAFDLTNNKYSVEVKDDNTTAEDEQLEIAKKYFINK